MKIEFQPKILKCEANFCHPWWTPEQENVTRRTRILSYNERYRQSLRQTMNFEVVQWLTAVTPRDVNHYEPQSFYHMIDPLPQSPENKKQKAKTEDDTNES